MIKNKLFWISLGCDKNRVDSEEMLGLLEAAGFSFTDDEYEADVIVVNTCCFIDDAKTESIETILEMAAMKEEGKCKKLVVAGCLSERYKEELLKEMPEVDAYIGTTDLSDIVEACRLDSSINSFVDYKEKIKKPDNRLITTGGYYEFLKIAEGCNKFCSYCIIPHIRGRYKSYPFDKLVAEAEFLAKSGVKELIVVAQETSIYGTDLYGENRLSELLTRLCEIDGLEWIRVLYCYPEDITDEFLEVMAKEPKICKYIDMPIQHASDSILKKMGRKTSRADIEDTIARARKIVPGVTLRTSLISGFPGETEEDHEILKEFVKKVKFDHLGVFSYSQEEGTRAAEFTGQIPEKIKNFRRDEIMRLQEQISSAILQLRIDKDFVVLIEGKLSEDNVYVGRTYMDAPDVDGFFYLNSDMELLSGDFVLARAVECSDYDLYGELIKKL